MAKCSVCGTILVSQESIPATGHNFVDNKCVCGLTLIYVDSAVVYDDYPFDWGKTHRSADAGHRCLLKIVAA